MNPTIVKKDGQEFVSQNGQLTNVAFADNTLLRSAGYSAPSVITPRSLDPVLPYNIPQGGTSGLVVSPYQPVEPKTLDAEAKFKATDPTGYANFKTANPNLQYTQEDENEFMRQQSTQSRSGIGAVTSRLLELAGLTPGSKSVAQQKSEVTKTANQEAGVDAKDAEVVRLTNEYREKEKYYNDQAEALRKTAGGTTAGVQDQLAILSRQKNSELANIAIQQQSAIGNYESAVRQANRKIDAQIAPLEEQVKNLQALYPLLQNDMSEKEKMNAQVLIQDKRDEAAAFRSSLENAYKVAIQNGAPTTILEAIGNSRNTTELYKALGKYGIVNQYQATTDAYGNPVVFNSRTGKFESSDGKDASKQIIGNDGKSYDLSTYATDPDHGIKIQNIMGQIGPIRSAEDVFRVFDQFVPNSPIDPMTVVNSAVKYGIDPSLLVSLMLVESRLGTRGAAVKTFNPGNVGNVDSGATRNMKTWEAGVDAAAQQLARRTTTSSPTQRLTKQQQSALNTVMDNARQDPDIKIFPDVRQAYDTAVTNANKKNGAGDVVLMRMIAKMTDPTTGVREEEFKTFAGAQSTLAQYGIKLTKQMWSGDRLNEFGRSELAKVAQEIYDQRKTAFDNSFQFFQTQAQQAGIPQGVNILPYNISSASKTNKTVSSADRDYINSLPLP